MKEFTARDVQRDFGHVMDEAQSGPVRLVMEGHGEVVAMSRERYERLRDQAWDRLFAAMDALAAEAAANGLDEEKLAELLADES